MSWNKYVTQKSILAKHHLSRVIIKHLGKTLKNFYTFDGSARKHQTRCIKDQLAILGDKKLPGKPKYKFYGHGISKRLRQEEGGKFKSSEWMWDVHWYTEGKDNYTTTTLPMVAECEWNPTKRGVKGIRFSGFKYDFQKLLVVNADLRVMIFKVTNLAHLDELDLYFTNNIKNYKNLQKGAMFLCMAFYDKEQTFYFREYRK